jgi:hypothetical protein
MSIDLDGLALIDIMLDAAIELRLMPDIWNEKEAKYLENIHTALLRLNRYWEDLESEELGGMEIMCLRNVLGSLGGYTELMCYGLEAGNLPEAVATLKRLARNVKLFYAKVDYLNNRLRREY